MSATPALLALEDGTVFRGESLGAETTTTGEVCFNTSMTGYQEILTDPSYHGQIVTMTAPQIGNTGVNDFDDQARRPFVAGLVVREASRSYSSWRAESSLQEYLRARGIAAIAEVDTRRLTRHLRTAGAMRGALSAAITSPDELVDLARAAPGLVGRDLASEVTTERAYTWGPGDLERRAASGFAAGAERPSSGASLMSEGAWPMSAGRSLLGTAGSRAPRRVAALDFGLKRNILDLLVAGGCEVTVLPATTAAGTILEGGYDGVFLSNGPGDPEPVEEGIQTVRGLLGRVPIFGICLGHQILGLALGGRTFKLPFGHRGGNHPVRRTGAASVEITCQNHGFAVDPASLGETPARVTHVNLNDGTVEGLEVPGTAFGVQYHPESGPGPHDSRYLFEQFRELITRFEPSSVLVAAGG